LGELEYAAGWTLWTLLMWWLSGSATLLAILMLIAIWMDNRPISQARILIDWRRMITKPRLLFALWKMRHLMKGH